MFPSDRFTLVERYAELLATEGVVRGLIGPREAPRLWDRHLLNCAVLGELLPQGATVCDIGSGAGLPGLVLAIARPDVRITLVEPLLRRTAFLEEVVDGLGLDTVEIFRGRAEELHGQRRFDVVTSRAVAPLERLLGWSMPLVAGSGALVAMKGSSITEEIEAAQDVLVHGGCGVPEVIVLGEGLLSSTTVAVRVPWADPTRVSWPLAVSRSPGAKNRPPQNRRKKRRPA
ncbi:16S rRNA (guanine527-N7)-methyltransferase [Nocardioides psychrotolerans]|uniref:Ribosomal RNA small subunit methyltransferase G n=1 Tax=Nocardioides psychrotolerans TaxID=1005945 RepID=A0A1I3GEH1_9ACTN|nr:16S rRNA (guanine527-N7)-methyltransferase [Nocardioides psychrotolerans]